MNIITECERGTFKHLHSIPSYINQKELKNFSNNVRILEIPSLHSFKLFCNENTGFISKGQNSGEIERDTNWAGTRTWDGFLELLENGDEAVIKKIKISTDKKVVEMSKKYKEVLTNFKFDVTGQFFDIGLVLQGAPESWLDPQHEEKEITRIDIILNISLSARDDEDTVINNAGRVIAMCKILEDHGVEVSIKGLIGQSNYQNNNDETFVSIIEMKGYDEPVNYQKLSILLSPAYFRRGIFKLMEVVSDNVNYGYGRPLKFEEFTSLADDRSVNKLEGRLFQ